MIKRITVLLGILAGSIALLMFTGCADYGNHKVTTEPPPVDVCEAYEDECDPGCETCPEPEVCEECQPPEDPCECIDFHAEGSTEKEERCLTEFAVRHGMCSDNKFDYKMYCPSPQGWWKGVKTWVRGCDLDQDHWTNH